MRKFRFKITLVLCLCSIFFLNSFQIINQVNTTPWHAKDFTDTIRLPQISQGLHGYISMHLPKQKEGFGYGISFYVSVWPLLEKPLSDFQIGLPGTWIVPDNRGFEEPLCPIGTLARDNWPERGPSYRDVFQTIEGGVGFWSNAKFGSLTPKFHMNATANCYNQMVSSPGWGPGQTKALKGTDMGLAQLSNHLLLPPDGVTFARGTSGEFMGRAYMALPIIGAQPKNKDGVATGDLNWTCFLNAANFKGPVAFYIPEFWSKIANRYPTAQGRTLDIREGVAGSAAIEINTVPRFEAADSKGNVYSRIPRLQFPVNKNGVTVLMEDVTLYSKNAIFLSLKNSLARGHNIAHQFKAEASYHPQCSTKPTLYDQGSKPSYISGVDSYFQTTMLGRASYGLKWNKWNKTLQMGYFPQYFKKEGDKLMAVSPEEVPEQTKLQEQIFTPAKTGMAYTSPTAKGTVWTSPGPTAGPYKAELNDGSVVTYYWYKFADQPSLQSLHLSGEEKNELQKRVELLQANWTINGEYMPPPSEGKLAAIDNAIIVNPPKGLEIGYVPIVTRQEAGK